MKRLDKYSQHFLRNPRFIKELVGHSSINKHDVVMDIGAGSGVIASVLAETCKEVIAVEAEPQTAAKLRANMSKFSNVAIKEADFMTMELPRAPYKVFANIPFHLSSPIVKRLTSGDHSPTATYLIVQKQFARKLLPDHKGFTSQLGMSIGPEFAVRIRRTLRRTDFWPHPNVDTVLLEIVKRDDPLLASHELPEYHDLVARSFPDPIYFSRIKKRYGTLPADSTPSRLTLSEWISLYRACSRS